MFQHLKSRNNQRSVFKDEILPARYSKSAGATSSVIKANEGTRLVRCKHCGWICDRERDVRAEDNTFAGLGVSYGDVQRTAATVGDTDNQISLNNTFVTATVTSSVTKTTDRISVFHSFDGDNDLDTIFGFQDSSDFSTVGFGTSAYQLMHNRVIKSIHAAVASAPGVGNEIQVVVCVDNATTDMRAVITGTNTYASSSTVSSLSTGSYAPVKIQVNYDDNPTLSMISYALVLEGSGEQTYHGPSQQSNNGTTATLWGMHGAYNGTSVTNSSIGQPQMFFRCVQAGEWSDLRVACKNIPAISATTAQKVSLSYNSSGSDWETDSNLSVILGTSGTTFSDTTGIHSAIVGEWIASVIDVSQSSRQDNTTIITQFKFTPNTSKYFQYCCSAQSFVQNNLVCHYGMVGIGGDVAITSAEISNGTYPEPYTVMPMNGTIKGATLEVTRTSQDEVTFTLRKNFVDTNLTFNVGSTSTISLLEGSSKFSSSTIEVDVVAGDKIGFTLSSPSAGGNANGALAWTFVPDNDNEYPVFFTGLVPAGLPSATTTTETYTVLVSTGEGLVGDAYSLRDVRSGCPSCGSYLYDGDEPFQEVKFDV